MRDEGRIGAGLMTEVSMAVREEDKDIIQYDTI